MCKKLTVAYLVKTFPTFMESRRLIAVCATAGSSASPPCPTARFSSVLFSTLRIRYARGLLPAGFLTKILYAFLSPPDLLDQSSDNR
jgi:hypothetical protein